MDIQNLLKPPVAYAYCYDCNIVLGKPDFDFDTVAAEYKVHKDKEHILSQSEWDAAVARGERK